MDTGDKKFTSVFVQVAQSYLHPDGTLAHALPSWAENAYLLMQFYKSMVLVRAIDKKAVAMQRTGQIGTYPSVLGQEAIGIAVNHCMDSDDVFVPYYRDFAAQHLRGMPLVNLFQYWGGDERGNNYTPIHDLPNCVPVSTQLSHAAGIAAAIRIREEPKVVVVTCGDGATSKGDFLESLNLAGVWRLPMVIVVNNNQWAISVPRTLQCGAKTLAHKAVAAGIKGIQVDGNDVIALSEVLSNAVDSARQRSSPTLVEAVTYRLADHTTADDSSRYRTAKELNEAWFREPVKRLRSYLHNQGVWDEAREKALIIDCQTRVQEAVTAYQSASSQPAESMFDYLFAELPIVLEKQRTAVIDKAARLDGET